MSDEVWQSRDATDYLETAQRTGFAWEFLRRNPNYRADYRKMRRDMTRGGMDHIASAVALARRWGLQFPVRSDASKRPGADALAPGSESGDRRTRTSPD